MSNIDKLIRSGEDVPRSVSFDRPISKILLRMVKELSCMGDGVWRFKHVHKPRTLHGPSNRMDGEAVFHRGGFSLFIREQMFPMSFRRIPLSQWKIS